MYLQAVQNIIYYIIMCPKKMNKTFVEKNVRTTTLSIITIIAYDIVNAIYH